MESATDHACYEQQQAVRGNRHVMTILSHVNHHEQARVHEWIAPVALVWFPRWSCFRSLVSNLQRDSKSYGTIECQLRNLHHNITHGWALVVHVHYAWARLQIWSLKSMFSDNRILKSRKDEFEFCMRISTRPRQNFVHSRTNLFWWTYSCQKLEETIDTVNKCHPPRYESVQLVHDCMRPGWRLMSQSQSKRLYSNVVIYFA